MGGVSALQAFSSTRPGNADPARSRAAIALAALWCLLGILGFVAGTTLADAQEPGLLVPAALSAPPEFIGAVQSGRAAFGTPVNLEPRALAPADDVFLDEVVETLAGGALHIEFVDGTVFLIG